VGTGTIIPEMKIVEAVWILRPSAPD
jgi:hypothetical protein